MHKLLKTIRYGTLFYLLLLIQVCVNLTYSARGSINTAFTPLKMFINVKDCTLKVKARLEVTGGTWILYSDQNYGGDLAVVTTSKAGRRMSFGQLATVRSAKKLSFLD